MAAGVVVDIIALGDAIPMLATLAFLISSIYKNPLDKKATSCYILTANRMLYIKEDETWYSKFPTPNLKL